MAAVQLMRIGLDFDNTIIRYDGVFLQAARDRGLLDSDFVGTKQQIRDVIRCLPDGETKWQALQGYVYGSGIGGAKLFAGLPEFLQRAQACGDKVLIISHKTMHGHFDPDRVELRTAALSWMETQGLFSGHGGGLAREHVQFTSTRKEKLKRIAELDCNVFIDDLEEVLIDPEFPPSVRRILFSEIATSADDQPYCICRDWSSISEVVFRDRR
jgi:hypothetical protein